VTFQILESVIVIGLNASFYEHSVRVASRLNSNRPPPSTDRNGQLCFRDYREIVSHRHGSGVSGLPH
jgi:hypothetical protein